MKSGTGAAAQRRGHRQHYRVRVLSAIGAAVPIRLLKRDLQFLLNQIAPLLDDWRLQTLARQHGIRKDRETDGIGKLFAAFVRRSHEGTLSRLLVEAAVLLAAARTNPAVVLREAAATYKIDTDAIALRVKQEFAAKVLSRSMRIGRLHFCARPSRPRVLPAFGGSGTISSHATGLGYEVPVELIRDFSSTTLAVHNITSYPEQH